MRLRRQAELADHQTIGKLEEGARPGEFVRLAPLRHRPRDFVTGLRRMMAGLVARLADDTSKSRPPLSRQCKRARRRPLKGSGAANQVSGCCLSATRGRVLDNGGALASRGRAVPPRASAVTPARRPAARSRICDCLVSCEAKAWRAVRCDGRFAASAGSEESRPRWLMLMHPRRSGVGPRAEWRAASWRAGMRKAYVLVFVLV